MNSSYFGDIDEILKSYGYIKCEGDSENASVKIDPTAGAKNNNCKDFNSDIPFGFQDIDPMLATVICEILSNVISDSLPTNVANAYGNWLQLIAQVIISFNAQQQYFQGGPGRYYNPVYRNVSNPFCSSAQTPNGSEHSDMGKTNNEDSRNDKCSSNKEINKLKKQVKNLKLQIQILEDEINSLK